MTAPTSKAAAERLAKGIQPGDFVLFGECVLKVRVPVEGLSSGAQHCKTRVPHMAEVVEVTPTGRFRVSAPGLGTVLLSAHNSLRAVKMTPEQVERRRRCLPGWF